MFSLQLEGVSHFHGNLRMPSRKIIITDKRTSDSLASCFLERKKNTVSRENKLIGLIMLHVSIGYRI